MNLSTLRKIVHDGEGPRMEWKALLNITTDPEKSEFAKDLAAMANTRPGNGKIIYGLANSGTVLGIAQEIGLDEKLQQVGSKRITPPVRFNLTWDTVNNKTLLLLDCPESNLRPHAISARDVYLRRGKTVDKATTQEVFEMKSEDRSEGSDMDIKELSSPQSPAPNFVYKTYENNFFPIEGLPTAYRTCKKWGKLDEPEHCPVFAAQFDNFVHPPEFGDSKSAIAFQHESYHFQTEAERFHTFVVSLEQSVLSPNLGFGVWRASPLNWSISTNGELDYGLGAENAWFAFRNRERGYFAGLIQFERADLYRPTSLLVAAAEFQKREQDLQVDQFGIKLMLSSIPLRRDWVKRIFEVSKILEDHSSAEVAADDALNEKVYFRSMIPEVDRKIALTSLGFMGRDPGPQRKFDIPVGLVVKTEPFRDLHFNLDKDDSWDDYYDSVFGIPTDYVDEIAVELTNPLPIWEEVTGQTIECRYPVIRELVVTTGHVMVSLINVHGHY